MRGRKVKLVESTTLSNMRDGASGCQPRDDQTVDQRFATVRLPGMSIREQAVAWPATQALT
jgi:hypothetical protein